MGGAETGVVITKSDLDPIIALEQIISGPPKPNIANQLYLERNTLFPLLNKVIEMLKITGNPAQGIGVDISNFSLTRDDLKPLRDIYNKFTSEEKMTVTRIIPNVMNSLFTKIITTPKQGDTGELRRSDIQPIVAVQQVLSGKAGNFVQKIMELPSSPAFAPLIIKLKEMVKLTPVFLRGSLSSAYLDLDVSNFSLTRDDIRPIYNMFYSLTAEERNAVRKMIPPILIPLFNKIITNPRQGDTGELTRSDIQVIVPAWNIICGVGKENVLQKIERQFSTLIPLTNKGREMIKVTLNDTDTNDLAQGVSVDYQNLSLTRDDLAPVRNIYNTMTVDEKIAISRILPPIFSRLWSKIISS